MRYFSSILLFAFHFPISAQELKEIPIESAAIVTFQVKDYPDFMVADHDGVWVTNVGRVEKMQWQLHTPTLSVKMKGPCGVMFIAYESLWVASCKSKSIYRIDLKSGKIQSVIETGLADPEGELSIAAGANAIWVLTNNKGELSKINPITNKVIAKIKVKANSYAVAYGFGSLWITNTSNSSVQQVDPKRNEVTAIIKVGSQPRFLTTGLGCVWTLNQEDGTVTKIDPATHQTTTIDADVKGSGGDITASDKYIYVRAKNTLLSVVDPVTNKVMKRYEPPAGSGAVCAENGRVWITAHDINKIWVLKE